MSQVYYPGLESHPQHELAKKQQAGFGGMVSFDIKGGLSDSAAFLTSLKEFSLAESLGGVESLICHPATMTHAGMDATARLEAGVGDTLIRISVGIEELDDLVADLEQAFKRTTPGQSKGSDEAKTFKLTPAHTVLW